MSAAVPKTPNEAALQLIGRDWLSYSALATFQHCPLQFYFRYVAALPEETVSASLVFGGAIHRSIEYHFRQLQAGQPPPELEALKAEYEAAWQEREPVEIQFGRDEDAGSLGEVADRVLAAFHESELARPEGTILGVGQELRGKLAAGCPDLLARVDLLVETASELVLTDIKTSRSRWSTGQAEESAEQLVLYSELAQSLAPEKRLRLEFAVLTKAKLPAVDRLPVEFNQRRVERTKQIFERVCAAIQSGHFYPTPSLSGSVFETRRNAGRHVKQQSTRIWAAGLLHAAYPIRPSKAGCGARIYSALLFLALSGQRLSRLSSLSALARQTACWSRSAAYGLPRGSLANGAAGQ